MHFISYYSDAELPISSNPKIIREDDCFCYLYDLDEEINFAVNVDCSQYPPYGLFAVFILDKNESHNDNEIIQMAKNIKKFYRETKGIQSKHISPSTIRKLETFCGLYGIKALNDMTLMSSSVSDMRLEKRHLKCENNNYWSITFNDLPIISLSSETAIDEFLKVIQNDIRAYIYQRWNHK